MVSGCNALLTVATGPRGRVGAGCQKQQEKGNGMTTQCLRRCLAGSGQRLALIVLAVSVVLISANVVKAQTSQVYTVQPGDSLWSIAKKYNTTVTAIKQANGLWSDIIYVGSRLHIPTANNVATALSSDDIRWLAQLVWSEAEGEPYAGMVAVAAVVLNRVKSPLFPNTVKGVIFDGWQFEPVINGRIYNPAPDIAYRAVYDALNGWDPSYGALYFFNPALTRNAFLWSRPVTTVIGRHRFTR